MNPNNSSEQEIEFEGQENFRNSREESLKDLVCKQFSRCQEYGSQEMHRGGNRKIIVNGRVEEISMPDNINRFSNAIRSLMATLAVFMKGEKEGSKLKSLFNTYESKKKEFDNWHKSNKIQFNIHTLNLQNKIITQEHYLGCLNDSINNKDRLELEIAYAGLEAASELINDKLKWFSEGGFGSK